MLIEDTRPIIKLKPKQCEECKSIRYRNGKTNKIRDIIKSKRYSSIRYCAITKKDIGFHEIPFWCPKIGIIK